MSVNYQSIDYVIDRVKKTGVNYVEIYEGEQLGDLNEVYSTFTIREGANVVDDLNYFKAQRHGKYTAVLRYAANNSRNKGERIFFTNYQAAQPGAASGIVLQGAQIDWSEREKQLRAEFAWELEKKLLSQRVTDALEEIKEMKKPEARLFNIIQELGTANRWPGFRGNVSNAAPAANSLNQPAQQMTDEFDIEKVTDQQADQLAEAMAKLVKMFGAGGVIKLTERVAADAGTQALIKNYAA